MLLTLFLVSILAFVAFQIIPGDPAVVLLGMEATPESLEALRVQMGLNRPAPARYFEWLGRFLFGDMGESYLSGMSVQEVIGDRLSITGALMMLSFLFTIAIALPIGIISARKKTGPISLGVTAVSQVGMAVPPLFLGIILTFIFSAVFQIFTPTAFPSYRENPVAFFSFLLLPAIAIALPKSAMAIRLIRSSVFAEMGQDYVRTAYSRGRGQRAVLYRHILPNIAVPVITFLLLTLTMMVTDAIVVERVFSIPGAGRLLIRAIETRDYPVVQSLVIIVAALVVGLNFLTDILCRAVDPRITR
jgi:peptide/nickel transport system permease protein